MTQGAAIPYHLRQNKAIDRNLFIDLLARIGRAVNISDYEYISFGGPFLEDFKAVHAALRVSRMISIELDENVFKRQAFNQPLSCLELKNESSEEFLNGYDFPTACVVWFDYSLPRVGIQLGELHRLVAKLKHGDVFKITVNASPAVLGIPKNDEDLQEFRVRRARDELADYAPSKLDGEDVITVNYPNVILRAIDNACKSGVTGSPELVVQPLTAFVYSDGQQMLTATAVLLSEEEQVEFMGKTRLSAWEFASLDWARAMPISVPQLSVKERLHVEQLLPAEGADGILNNLGYYVGDSEGEGAQLMENFVRYYRMYPWYSRVVV